MESNKEYELINKYRDTKLKYSPLLELDQNDVLAQIDQDKLDQILTFGIVNDDTIEYIHEYNILFHPDIQQYRNLREDKKWMYIGVLIYNMDNMEEYFNFLYDYFPTLIIQKNTQKYNNYYEQGIIKGTWSYLKDQFKSFTKQQTNGIYNDYSKKNIAKDPSINYIRILIQKDQYLMPPLVHDKYKVLLITNPRQMSIQSFPKLEKLQFLQLIGCKLNDVSALKDKNLVSLISLNLAHNNITSIKELGKLDKLERLFIDDNQLESLDFGTNYDKLKEVGASYNRISQVSLDRIPNVEQLDLKSNNINQLSEWNHDKLQKLNLANNRIERIYNMNIPNIRLLELYDNQLQSLQESFKNMNDLKYLDLANNQLSTLVGLPYLPKLRHLYLGQNNFDTLEAIPFYPELKVLGISDNQISTFQGMINYQNLRKLFIQNNRIRSFEGLLNLQNLKKLNVSFNAIESFQHMPNLPNLETLLMTHNDIYLFRDMPQLDNLKYFTINDNLISSINDLPKLISLQSLKIDNNQLPKQDKDTLIQMAKTNNIRIRV